MILPHLASPTRVAQLLRDDGSVYRVMVAQSSPEWRLSTSEIFTNKLTEDEFTAQVFESTEDME